MLACLSKLGMMLEEWDWNGDNEKNVGTHVNVISFTRTQKAWPSILQIFTKLTNAQRHYFQIPCTKFHPKDTINVECTCVKKLTSLSRVWLSQRWFSWNLLLPSIFVDVSCSEFYSNCIKNVENMGNIPFMPLHKVSFHWADLYKAHTCLTNFIKKTFTLNFIKIWQMNQSLIVGHQQPGGYTDVVFTLGILITL